MKALDVPSPVPRSVDHPLLPCVQVSFGSFATEMGIPRHVWFTPDSDRIADIAGGPFRANTRRQFHLQAFSSSLAWAWFQTSEIVR
jgi:hypothetical protein